jgi:hypothetical protein
MSHLKERSEKNCLNCGTIVAGRYCQQCGQENVEVKESFFHLLVHFIEDLTHFDGKLWKTLKLLLFKPGSLTKYYMEGKRATYLHPIRMYLFVSAIFFLVVFSGELPDKSAQNQPAPIGAPKKDIAKDLGEELRFDFGNDTTRYATVEAYEKAQSLLPIEKKDNWLERALEKKSIQLNQKYAGDKFEIGKALIEQFRHYFSRMLYISLPVFAFFIWILYRRNKNHYFVDHIIFSIHIYCAYFIILFVVKNIELVYENLMHTPFTVLDIFVALLLPYYLYKSLRNHFHQSRAKTLVKFSILTTLTMVLMGVLMFSFFLLSFFNI